LSLIGDARDPAHERVEDAGESMLQGALVASDSPRVDDVSLLRTREREHLGDQLRRILQVRVHDGDVVTARVVEPRCHGDLHSEVAGQLDEDRAIVATRPRLDQLSGTIGRAVVHVDDLVTAVEVGEALVEPTPEVR
jgi:hypothetical protein